MSASMAMLSSASTVHAQRCPYAQAPVRLQAGRPDRTCAHSSARRASAHVVRATPTPPASAGKIVEVKEDYPEDCSDLLELTEKWIDNGGYFGPFTEDSMAMMDKDFVFRGPVAGPLNRKSYITVLSAVSPHVAFPDFKHNGFGFVNDPQNPYRVWFIVSETGTNSVPWKFPGVPGEIGPSGKPILCSPSVYSLIWTPDRKVQYVSVGYAIDRIVSNAQEGSMTVGLFGLLKTAGVPVPKIEGGLVTTGLFKAIGAIQGDSDFTPTPWEKLPAWFQAYPNSKLVGPENF